MVDAGGAPITSMLSRSSRLSMLMGACSVLPVRMSTSFTVRSTTCAKAPLQSMQDGAVTKRKPNTVITQQHFTASKLTFLPLRMPSHAAPES